MRFHFDLVAILDKFASIKWKLGVECLIPDIYIILKNLGIVLLFGLGGVELLALKMAMVTRHWAEDAGIAADAVGIQLLVF